MDSQIRARVFISCGQQKDSDETKIAQEIADKLTDMGFAPYIAVTEHTLEGVKENIFRRLGKSEYIIFVDFKRDRLANVGRVFLKDSGEHRGSLFSNQELGIATYLGTECLAFQEQGVRELDGILRFIQANCMKFDNRSSLADMVVNKVKEKINNKEWDPAWRNELRLRRKDSRDYVPAYIGGDKANIGRYFHVEVQNLHRAQIAHDCIGYIERIKNLATGKEMVPDIVELKWRGYTDLRASIPPQKSRDLDAFHIREVMPKTINLGINVAPVDYSGYLQTYTLWEAYDCDIDYVVFSDNFPAVRQTFRVKMGDELDDIEFSEIPIADA
jgi:hypothetical protein